MRRFVPSFSPRSAAPVPIPKRPIIALSGDYVATLEKAHRTSNRRAEGSRKAYAGALGGRRRRLEDLWRQSAPIATNTSTLRASASISVPRPALPAPRANSRIAFRGCLLRTRAASGGRPAVKKFPRAYSASSVGHRMSVFPKVPPLSMAINREGASSSPSVISSR